MFNSILKKQITSFFILFIVIFSAQSFAETNKNLWPMWEANNPLSTKKISHQKWQKFLDTRVITNDEGINLVDYQGITAEEKAGLKSYIKEMSEINIDDYNRNEQLAFWINLYNALTIQVISEYYPISTIRDIKISPGLFSIGPWGANLVSVTDTQLSLDEIQNRIIRPIWNDPRTLYTLNNGTIGAANLSKSVYTGESINSQLNKVAYQYVNSLRGVQVNEGKLVLSKIYKWYADDIGDGEQDIIYHLKQFANDSLRKKLKNIKKIDGYFYNWHLNARIKH